MEGRKVKVPVFSAGVQLSPQIEPYKLFMSGLVAAINAPIFRDGEWQLCARSGWPDNPSFENLVAWSWAKGEDRRLIVINLSDNPVQAQVQVPWSEIQGETWHRGGCTVGCKLRRNGDEMLSPGLYVELGPWNCNFFPVQSYR